LVRSLGATPIDYRAGRIDSAVRKLAPNGVDYAFDAVGGSGIGQCIGALRRGGTLVGFGFMGAKSLSSKIAMFANLLIGAPLRGRHGKFYGISALYKRDPKPFREDLPKIFDLLAQKKIDPAVKHTFGLLQAKEAVELVASGSAVGKIVLTGGPAS
jgi:NADPH:quinone reductase